MSALPWFRVYAADELLSTDLEELSDHAARVWWRALCVAALNDPRWDLPPESPGLARRLMTTPAKLGALLGEFEARGLLLRGDAGALRIANWERYDPPPSSSRDAMAARKRLSRIRAAEGVTVTSHARSDQIRSEVEKERDQIRTAAAKQAAEAPPAPTQIPLRPFMVALADHRDRILREAPELPLREAQRRALAEAYQEQGLDRADAERRAGIVVSVLPGSEAAS